MISFTVGSTVIFKQCLIFRTTQPDNLINLLIYTDFKAYHGRADKRDGECRMTTAARPLPYFLPFSPAFQKGSPYTAIYNYKYFKKSHL